MMSSRRTDLGALAFCLTAAVTAAGCFGARAKAVTTPTLDMPAPPPRVVEVNTPAPSPPIPLPEEPVRNLQPQPGPAPEAPRASGGPKADPSSDVVRPADESGRPAAGALQTTSTLEEADVERRIRSQLARAAAALSRVSYRSLDADARLQYDTARRFIAQAEEAVRARNLVFGTNLAEKAAMLAAQLAGR